MSHGNGEVEAVGEIVLQKVLPRPAAAAAAAAGIGRNDKFAGLGTAPLTFVLPPVRIRVRGAIFVGDGSAGGMRRQRFAIAAQIRTEVRHFLHQPVTQRDDHLRYQLGVGFQLEQAFERTRKISVARQLAAKRLDLFGDALRPPARIALH